MILPMLVVDKNIEVSLKEQSAWLRHGIPTVRVESMQQAIKKLTQGSFLFTTINADNIEYLPLLKAIREIAAVPIFVIDSQYTPMKEIKALNNGADVYAAFSGDMELNVQLALGKLSRCNEMVKSHQKTIKMSIYDSFLILSDQRRIFYNDKRLKLSRIEYEILHYLIENHDIFLTYEKIYSKVWGRDYYLSEHGLLWNYIFKVRRILRSAGCEKEYITTERDTGYLFSATTE